MKLALPMSTLLAVALVACTDRVPVAPVDPAPAADSTSAGDQPEQDVPPATAPPPPTPPSTDTLARFDGYGDMRFGMTAAEAKAAWGGDLNGASDADSTCYYLNPIGQPSPAHFAFMIDGDRFVRYDVGNDKEVAPGGGKRGMSEAEIERLYAGRIERQNHKYVEGGEYLKIKDSAGGNGVLVFETDAAGTVSAWHLGVPPQVDYVEGCS